MKHFFVFDDFMLFIWLLRYAKCRFIPMCLISFVVHGNFRTSVIAVFSDFFLFFMFSILEANETFLRLEF